MDISDTDFPRVPGPRSEGLEGLQRWLDELRESDAAIGQYALGIVKKHLSGAGLSTTGQFEPVISWWHFCWSLYLNLSALLKAGEHDALVRDMLQELVRFCSLIPDEYFVVRLSSMLEYFLDSAPQRSRITPLLPASAREKLVEIDQILQASHEEEMRRMDQMGY